MGQKYYAVKNGLKTGIYLSWDECSKQVLGFNGAQFKSFSNYEDALSYMNDNLKTIDLDRTISYVDGSYDAVTKCYSFGAILLLDGKLYSFKKKFEPDDFSDSRNIAGEIKGACFIMNYCLKNNIKEIDLYFDYNGIEKWFTGEWKAKSNIGLKYIEFRNSLAGKLKVNFFKVKGHSNVYYNEMVDRLAKDALGIK